MLQACLIMSFLMNLKSILMGVVRIWYPMPIFGAPSGHAQWGLSRLKRALGHIVQVVW
jgi:hypothetical protein